MAILATFALVARTVFARTLYDQMIARLVTLGQSVAVSADYENGVLKPDDYTEVQSLVRQRQALQWFDWQGQEIERQGKDILTVPIWPERPIQIQGKQALGVTVPIVDGADKQPVGYVRVSESLDEINRELRNLDLGLGGGILIALTLSGAGGIWLTRQSMKPIEQSFQRLQQFTADASHELRSPLMAIKSNVSVALKYPEGIRESDAEKFEAISSAVRQMTHLTEDLLFLARNERMPQHDWQRVSITALLNHLALLYQPEAVERAIQLKASLKNELWIKGNIAQLTRLFTNLIDNALHYTPAGGSIEMKAEQIAAYVEIHVQDTGVGIPPEHLEKVFDRFWRADSSRAQWEGGAGLGLSIARSIAQGHNGSISVTSQPGVGSCFSVRFPACD